MKMEAKNDLISICGFFLSRICFSCLEKAKKTSDLVVCNDLPMVESKKSP